MNACTSPRCKNSNYSIMLQKYISNHSINKTKCMKFHIYTLTEERKIVATCLFVRFIVVGYNIRPFVSFEFRLYAVCYLNVRTGILNKLITPKIPRKNFMHQNWEPFTATSVIFRYVSNISTSKCKREFTSLLVVTKTTNERV